jgi:hypothetical protein
MPNGFFMRIKHIFCFLIFATASACTETKTSENSTADLDSLSYADTNKIQYIISGNNDNEDIYKIIQSIPHSLEAISIIPRAGHQYLKVALPAEAKYQKAEDLEKAFNLGMLTASLGYAAAQREFDDFSKILHTIDRVKSDLGLSKHIEDETLKTLIEEKEIDIKTLDSVLQLSTLNYDRINYELTRLDKEHFSVAILVGAWLEYSYLQILAFNQTRDRNIKTKILEQKIIVELLVRVTNQCKEKPEKILNDIIDVQKAYAPVKINDCDGLPKMRIENGEILIDAPCELIANEVSDADFKKIEQAIFKMHRQHKL